MAENLGLLLVSPAYLLLRTSSSPGVLDLLVMNSLLR